MFKRLMMRWVLMEEAGGADAGGGAPAAAAPAAAPAAGAPAAQPADGLTPPPSILGDGSPEAAPADGGKKPDDAAAEPPKPNEPVQYEPFKLPDGVAVDEAKLGDFTKLAAEAGVPQETAQKLVDMYTTELKQLTEAPYRAWTDLQTTWRNEVINDPVIGGANLEKNLAATKAGMNALLGEDAKSFFEALNITGAGNNPAIVRGLIKAAAPHAPASPVAGQPGKSTKSAGETLYPNQSKLGNGHEG